MNELIVVGLLVATLSATSEQQVDAIVVAYSEKPTTIMVENQSYSIAAGETMNIHVPLEVKKGVEHRTIHVQTEQTTYALPLTIIGKSNHANVWWLLALPIGVLLWSVSVRRINAGNS